MTERAVPAMTGESQVEEPRTEAGRTLDDLREEVLNLQARWMLSEGDEADARCGAYDDVLDLIELAAITALRQPQEAKDTRGEPR